MLNLLIMNVEILFMEIKIEQQISDIDHLN